MSEPKFTEANNNASKLEKMAHGQKLHIYCEMIVMKIAGECNEMIGSHGCRIYEDLH